MIHRSSKRVLRQRKIDLSSVENVTGQPSRTTVVVEHVIVDLVEAVRMRVDVQNSIEESRSAGKDVSTRGWRRTAALESSAQIHVMKKRERCEGGWIGDEGRR